MIFKGWNRQNLKGNLNEDSFSKMSSSRTFLSWAISFCLFVFASLRCQVFATLVDTFYYDRLPYPRFSAQFRASWRNFMPHFKFYKTPKNRSPSTKRILTEHDEKMKRLKIWMSNDGKLIVNNNTKKHKRERGVMDCIVVMTWCQGRSRAWWGARWCW